MTKISYSAAAAALVALAACTAPPAAPPPPDAAAIKTALEKEIAKFSPLLASKDAAGLTALFTADATWVLPDASTHVGKDAILAGGKAFMDSMDSFTIESNVIDKFIVVNDSEAVTFSHGVGTLKLKGAKTTERHINPYADYWKKTADGWKIAYEINADGPMPEPKKP